MPGTPPYHEKEILALVAIGDEKAFTTLVHQYWNHIYTVSLTFVKNTQTAQDIVQEVFIKVWDKRASLPGVENFSGWIFIMARNTIISFLRKKEPVFASAEHVVGDQLSVDLPDDALRLKELQQIVLEGIGQLPAQQRLIYTLSREEGLSHDEICQQLGLARSTVKNSLVKSLNFLREYLSHHNDPYLLAMAIMLQFV